MTTPTQGDRRLGDAGRSGEGPGSREDVPPTDRNQTAAGDHPRQSNSRLAVNHLSLLWLSNAYTRVYHCTITILDMDVYQLNWYIHACIRYVASSITSKSNILAGQQYNRQTLYHCFMYTVPDSSKRWSGISYQYTTEVPQLQDIYVHIIQDHQ